MLNQKLLFEICSYLSDQVYNNTITRNSKQINDQIIVIACFYLQISFAFCSPITIIENLQNRGNFLAILCSTSINMLWSLNQNIHITQLTRLKIIIQPNFTLLMRNKRKVKYILQTNRQNKLIELLKINIQKAKVNTTKFLIFIYTMFIGFLIVNLSNTLILSEFIKKYKPTATMHKNTSDLCFNIALTYSLKEQLNNQVFFPYLKDSDFKYMIYWLNQSSLQIKQYQQELLNKNQVNLLFRPDFVSYFLDQDTNDICQLINESNNQQIQQICINSFEGSFLLGIQAVLNHVSKIITQELITEDFSQRKPINALEVEGAYLFAEFLQMSSVRAMRNFSEQVLNQKSILEVYFQIKQKILVSSISFTLILVAIIMIALETNLKFKLTYAIKFIHLVPREVLFLDDAFERKIRMAILKNPNL